MRQQIVARVACGNFHDLASRAKFFDVFLKDNLHGFLVFYRIQRTKISPQRAQRKPRISAECLQICVFLSLTLWSLCPLC